MKRMERTARLVAMGAVAAGLILGCGGDQKKKQTTTPKKLAKKKDPQQPNTPAPNTPAPQPDKTPADNAPAAPTPVDTGKVGADAPPPVAMIKTARSLLKRKQYEAAIRQCKAALRRSEKYTPAMEVMAQAYYRLGKTEFASSICDIALGIQPSSARCHNLKGFIALKNKDRPEALKNFKKATQVQPGYGPAWVNLGAQYLHAKAWPQAKVALEKAVKLLPARAEVHLNLGAAYRGTNDLVKALRELKKALQLRPNYPEAYFNLGVLYLDANPFPGMVKLKQLQTAVTYFNKYRQVAPSRGKDDPVDTYLKAASRAIRREQRRIKREQRRKKREAAKKAKAAAAAKKKKAAPKPKPKTGGGSK